MQLITDRTVNIHHWILGIQLFLWTWYILSHNTILPYSIYIWTVEVISPETFNVTLPIASSWMLCNFINYFSQYSIALDLVFNAYILFPLFPNILSPFQQTMSISSQVRNHYSLKNQELQLEGALTLTDSKTANLSCASNIWHPALCLYALYCWLLVLLIL